MAYMHPLAHMLGLEGIALLRAHAGDSFDRDFVHRRFEEVRRLLDEAAAEVGDGTEAHPIGTVDGYRTWSETYDEERNSLIAVEEPVVREILDGLPVGRALDAACGTGRHAAYLAELGHQVTGVDSSPDMLSRARARLPEADLLPGDLHVLPVDDDTTDVVVCSLALTHLPDLAPALAEFARVLRPGGHLVLSDIHVMSLYLSGVVKVADDDGGLYLLPASRFLASDYLAAALPLGFVPRRCTEPRWGPRAHAGGPYAQRWCQEAADAAYSDTPAAIVWHFQLTGD